MSVFVALDLDDVVRGQVAAVIDAARSRVDAKWLRTDKLHLTLAFLGNPTPERIEQLARSLQPVALRLAPFSLQVVGAGTFVTARAPSVLWLGVGGALDTLAMTQREVSSAVQAEEREWVPHVTLARARSDDAFTTLRAELSGFSSAVFTAAHCTLYESTHSNYRALHRFDFARVD